MKELLLGAVSVCGVILLAEVLTRLCEENAMLRFVRGLSTLLLLVSLVFSVFHADWSVTLSKKKTQALGGELTEYVSDQIDTAAREELTAYFKGLLAAAGLQAEKIEVLTSIREDRSIVLDKVGLLFRYESDCERARALLSNVLGDEIEVEVDAED